MEKLGEVRTGGQRMNRILVLLTLAVAEMAAGVTAAQAEITTNEHRFVSPSAARSVFCPGRSIGLEG